MGLVELLLLLLIAAMVGLIAEAIVGFSPGGLVVSILVGLLGAYLGGWLAGRLGLPPVLQISAATTAGGVTFDVVWSVLGAILLLLIISLVRGVGRRRVVV